MYHGYSQLVKITTQKTKYLSHIYNSSAYEDLPYNRKV